MLCVWISGHPRYADSPAIEMNEEQNVVGNKTAPGEHFYGKAVDTGQDCHVRGDEILPGGRLGSLRCGRDAVSAEDVSHRLIANVMTEIGQGSRDSVISPAGIFPRHPDNQFDDFVRDRRATRTLAVS